MTTKARRDISFRKMRVQQFNKVIELLGSTGLKVLKMLGAGNTATQTAKAIGCVKSNITYWKNKLLLMGLLKIQTSDVFKIYSLTPYGSKIVARSERFGVGVETVVLEDDAVKFLVLEGERVRLDWMKLGSPRNWSQLGVKIGGVRVERTSRHVIVHPGKLRGWDPHELLVDAGRIVERVKMVLENTFGMVLSDVAVRLHKPVFRFYSPEAKELVKHGTISVHNKKGERVGAIDESPPERVPHEEYDGAKLAQQRLLLPFTLQRLEHKVDSLTSTVVKLVDGVEKLADCLTQLLPQSPSQTNSKPGVDYVA